MASFKFQYIRCDLDYIPNDVNIKIQAYLTDAAGAIFVSSATLGLDTFTLQTYKSSLPVSGYASFLSIIAGKFISEKYNSTHGGSSIKGSNIITGISDTTSIVPGLFVFGTDVPTDTIVLNIRDKNSIELNNPMQSTASLSLTLSTHGWDVDYTQLQHLADILDFAHI